MRFTKKKKKKKKHDKVCIQHIGTYYTNLFILSIYSNVRNVHNGRRQKMLHSYKWIEMYLNLYSSSLTHTRHLVGTTDQACSSGFYFRIA